METFQSILKKYLRQIQVHQANLNSLNGIIQDEIRRANKEIDSGKFSYSHLVISDLTGPTDSGWEINYSSGLDSTVKDYRKELTRILLGECSQTVAQCYERLETFLKDSLALHFYTDSNNTADKALRGLKSFSEFKQGVRKIRSTDNKELFNILRRTCPTYKISEEQNNLGFDLYQWYKVLSAARHAITHQSGMIKKQQLDKLQKFEFELLYHYFPGKYRGDIYMIEIPLETARSTIKRIAEFGFTIFKSLSMHHHKSWMILHK